MEERERMTEEMQMQIPGQKEDGAVNLEVFYLTVKRNEHMEEQNKMAQQLTARREDMRRAQEAYAECSGLVNYHNAEVQKCTTRLQEIEGSPTDPGTESGGDGTGEGAVETGEETDPDADREEGSETAQEAADVFSKELHLVEA
jgi:hypothetical protein